jgi:hypothetical protein
LVSVGTDLDVPISLSIFTTSSLVPISQVNIPVLGLQNYCDYLIAKGAEYPKPRVVDPRFQGRNTDMNIDDPFGNGLVFCSQRTEG